MLYTEVSVSSSDRICSDSESLKVVSVSEQFGYRDVLCKTCELILSQQSKCQPKLTNSCSSWTLKQSIDKRPHWLCCNTYYQLEISLNIKSAYFGSKTGCWTPPPYIGCCCCWYCVCIIVISGLWKEGGAGTVLPKTGWVMGSPWIRGTWEGFKALPFDLDVNMLMGGGSFQPGPEETGGM